MTKNRKVLFLSLALVAVILVLGGTTVSGYVQASKYKMNLNYNYQRAVTDLGDCVDNIESTLNKSIYANTPSAAFAILVSRINFAARPFC